HHHRAGVQDAKQRRDKLRAILHPQRHPITRADAELLAQYTSDEQRLAPKFRIRIRTIAPEQRRFFIMLLRRSGKATGQIHHVKYYAGYVPGASRLAKVTL